MSGGALPPGVATTDVEGVICSGGAGRNLPRHLSDAPEELEHVSKLCKASSGFAEVAK